jgi:hypothetical protein
MTTFLGAIEVYSKALLLFNLADMFVSRDALIIRNRKENF